MKDFDRRALEAGTSVIPGHPGRKLQVGLLPDRLGEGRSKGCRHGWTGGCRDEGSYLMVQLSHEKVSARTNLKLEL